jgi:hypothetical protein
MISDDDQLNSEFGPYNLIRSACLAERCGKLVGTRTVAFLERVLSFAILMCCSVSISLLSSFVCYADELLRFDSS